MFASTTALPEVLLVESYRTFTSPGNTVSGIVYYCTSTTALLKSAHWYVYGICTHHQAVDSLIWAGNRDTVNDWRKEHGLSEMPISNLGENLCNKPEKILVYI